MKGIEETNFYAVNGQQIAYGTDNGVYFGDMRGTREPIHVLALPDVTQVDVLQEYDLLVVLSGTGDHFNLTTSF